MFESQTEFVRNEEARMTNVTNQYCEFIESLRTGAEWYLKIEAQKLLDMYYKDMKYEFYLKTARWQDTRDRCLKANGYRCVFCGNGDGLHIHHVQYDRRGERTEFCDCVPLCEVCHNKIENLKVRFKNLVLSKLDRDETFDRCQLVEKSVESFLWMKRNTTNFVKRNHEKIVRTIIKSLASTIGIDMNNDSGLIHHDVVLKISERQKK